MTEVQLLFNVKIITLFNVNVGNTQNTVLENNKFSIFSELHFKLKSGISKAIHFIKKKTILLKKYRSTDKTLILQNNDIFPVRDFWNRRTFLTGLFLNSKKFQSILSEVSIKCCTNFQILGKITGSKKKTVKTRRKNKKAFKMVKEFKKSQKNKELQKKTPNKIEKQKN